MRIEQAYEQRNLGVTIFRAVFVTLLLTGFAVLYLSKVSTTSAIYGGVSALLVPVLTLAAALVIYLPANRQLRGVYQVRTPSIFKHQHDQVVDKRRSENDVLDRLERDLDF